MVTLLLGHPVLRYMCIKLQYNFFRIMCFLLNLILDWFFESGRMVFCTAGLLCLFLFCFVLIRFAL